jgi:hypothetical protein
MEDLASYLNDHLAGSVSALELIEHWAHLHDGKPLGEFFREIEAEIRADQDKLREVMHHLSIKESSMRQAGAWIAEKIGRARLMIAGDKAAELGLVLALEGLIMGVHGKELLWRVLATVNLPGLKEFDFGELQNRARQQMERIDAERLRAAQRVFTNPPH